MKGLRAGQVEQTSDWLNTTLGWVESDYGGKKTTCINIRITCLCVCNFPCNTLIGVVCVKPLYPTIQLFKIEAHSYIRHTALGITSGALKTIRLMGGGGEFQGYLI